MKQNITFKIFNWNIISALLNYININIKLLYKNKNK